MDEGRYILSNGELAPLTKKELTARMVAKKGLKSFVKPDGLPPLDNLTA